MQTGMTGSGCLGTSSQRLQGSPCSMRSKPLGHRRLQQYDLGKRQSMRYARILWGQRRCFGQCSSVDSDSAGTSVEVAPGNAFSAIIRQELLLFLVQLDFDRQLQRALNYENTEAADAIRSRRDVLNTAVEKFQDSKGSGDGCRDARQPEVADYATEGLRLRSELQRSIDDERYQDASRIQGQLKELQASSEQAATLAAQEREGLTDRSFCLGQRVQHAVHGYRAVVCGWDVQCCEGEAWQTDNGTAELKRSANQPFYHLLVDLRDWEEGPPDAAIVYVPEDQLTAPQESLAAVASDDSLDEDDERLQHPFGSVLFLGTDNAGDMLPTRKLRQKYSVQRRDVGPATSGGEDDNKSPGSPDSSDGPDDDGPSGTDFGGMRIL